MKPRGPDSERRSRAAPSSCLPTRICKVGNEPLKIERIRLSGHAIEVAPDVLLPQPHSRLGPLRGSKPSGPERQLCGGVHARHRAPRKTLVRRQPQKLGINGLWGGTVELVKSYATITVRSDIEESPDHHAPTSAFTEVDVDHGPKRP